MRLFFDTETTGKAHFNLSPLSDVQPRIVQLAAILIDDTESEVMSMNVIIRPDGWTIPDEAASIHGITTDFAERVGVPLKTALNMFGRMKRAAVGYVAHNIDFDQFVVLSNSEREFGQPFSIPTVDCFCTMKAMTEICQIPGNYGFKWPKLTEAYKHAFNSDFDGAHDALADVRACAKLFFWLKKREVAV